MADKTPRNRLPFPFEREEGYYATMKSFFLAVDAAHWADAENGNLTFNGGGLFAWSASSNSLTWSSAVNVTGFTSPSKAKAVIAGPPAPGGQLTIQDGEVVFFTMPRLMLTDTVVQLKTATRINTSDGTRLHDLRLFCARLGDTILFPDGKSLKDGESAILFGGGIGSTIPPHQHQPTLVIEPPATNVSTLDLQVTLIGDAKLVVVSQVGVFTVGDTLTGNVSGSSGTVSSVGTNFSTITAGSITGPGFQVGEQVQSNATVVQIFVNAIAGTFNLNDTVTIGGASGVIRKVFGSPTPTSFYVKVTAGTFPGSGTLTDSNTAATANITSTVMIGNPFADIVSVIPPSNLLRVDLYRNGQLLTEGASADYTVNYATGIVTLTQPTVSTTERFVALRTTTPIGATGIQHQHLRYPYPVVITTPTIPLYANSNNPSPNKLVAVDLYRNGALLVEPDDYSLDLPTGIITLTIPAIPGEIFIADRQVE